jgi:hypothetical protein
MSNISPPCLTIEQCAQAMKMEEAGFSLKAIAESFNVKRNSLVLTLGYAKEYGFAYFAYHGQLIDHLGTLRALGAKRYSYGVYDAFVNHTGLSMNRAVFSAALAKIRPYL